MFWPFNLRACARAMTCALFVVMAAFGAEAHANSLRVAALLDNGIERGVERGYLHATWHKSDFNQAVWAPNFSDPRKDTDLARRWSWAKKRVESEIRWLTSCERGACRDPRASDWKRRVHQVKSVPRAQRPALAHRLVHRSIDYVKDHPEDDYWATPLMTLSRGAGDCEDHVLLKRALLLAAGYEDHELPMLILETAQGQGHLVLEATTNQQLILDNRYARVVSTRAIQADRVAAVANGSGYYLTTRQDL